MDRGAWQATVHGVTKSRTRLSNYHFVGGKGMIYTAVEQRRKGFLGTWNSANILRQEYAWLI